jgi:hypothetical protein
MNGMTYERPWLALLGWLPPIYLLGIVRHWGKPWCTTDRIVLTLPTPVLWWPTRLYKHQRYQRGYSRR